MRRLIRSLLVAMALDGIAQCANAQGFSLRFYGHGRDDIDRVKLPLLTPQQQSRPLNVGGDLTLEFWIRFLKSENPAPLFSSGSGDGWIGGNILLDRDIFGTGDYGDYGLSLAGGRRIAFGVNRSGEGYTLVSTTDLTEQTWHHIAVTRKSSNGKMQIFVDGRLDASADGPTGNIAYRPEREVAWPNEPFLILGAEKHDYDQYANLIPPQYPSFSGWLDELRVSSKVRYTTDFSPPLQPFSLDADTAALYHFDAGSGNLIEDALGTSSGERKFGGQSPAGPAWATETPFTLVSVSGAVLFPGLVANALLPSVSVVFRPQDGSASSTRTFTPTTGGAFTLTEIPRAKYTLHFKATNRLAANLAADTTLHSVTGLAVTLLPGDANNDNACDLFDLATLAEAFNTSPGEVQWNPLTDFNGDISVNIFDLALLAEYFNLLGDP